MILNKVSSWWRGVPQKTRVRLIATVLLILAGTEFFVLAPYIFDLAVMIDVGGLVFVLAAVQASVSVSAVQLRELMAVIMRPFFSALRLSEFVAEYGTSLSPQWERHYLWVGRTATTCCRLVLFISIVGFAVTKVVIAIR